MQKKEDIYESQKIDAPRNKMDKWNTIFQENRFLKCKSSAEKKKLQVFKKTFSDLGMKTDFLTVLGFLPQDKETDRMTLLQQ